MSDGIDADDLSEEQLRRLAQSPLARLALACAEVRDAAEEIRQNDLMWDRLTEDVADASSRIDSEATAEDVLETFLGQIEQYGSLADGDDAESEAVEDPVDYTDPETGPHA